MPVFLKPFESDDDSQVFSFEKDRIRVGRQPDNDLSFDPAKHPSVSGYHAEIYSDREEVFLRDLQSRNGTLVNSRKISQPVSLKEGDLLQFSARGPKFIFSRKDPSASDEPSINFAETGSPTLIAPIETALRQPQRKPSFLERVKPVLPPVTAATGLTMLVGFGLYLDFAWWKLLIASALTLLVAGGAYLGWRLWKRRKKAAEQSKALRDESEGVVASGDGNDGNLPALRKKWAEVLRSLRDSKLQRSGEEAIYAFPWFLVLGEPAAGKSALIRAGAPLSSIVSAKHDGPTENCDWWFFSKAVIIDTSGKYVFQSKEDGAAKEWQELLQLLRANRRQEPLNGVIVTVPAEALISRPLDRLKEEAAHIRERLDEIVQRLGVKVPVYLTITKCDLIDGFSELFSVLPEQARAQASGYTNTDPQGNADAGRFLDNGLRTMAERLERLRLAGFYGDEENSKLRCMFVFPAELRTLETPLKGFVDVLFRPSPYRDAPFFRGVFFTSSREGGARSSRLARLLGFASPGPAPQTQARDYFLRDFFSIILPNDRSLAGRTALSREGFGLSRAAGVIVSVAASLLVCGILTLSFTNNWLALSRLIVTPCITSGSNTASFSHLLRPLDECRASVESVMPRTFWKRIAYDFGLGYSRRVGEALQQRYLAEFRAKVTTPVDAKIDKSLSGNDADALMVSFIVQRLQLLADCQQNGKCVDHDNQNGLSYQTMLAVAQSQVREGDPDVERLQRTHKAFLLWQTDPNVLTEMYSKDLQRIRNWSSRGRLTEEWVLQSTKSQFPPVRASDFWGGKTPLQVDGAYTSRAWREGIAPLLSGLQKMAADQDFGMALKTFHENYRRRALTQWENFLARFSDGESSVASVSMTREFGVRILSGDSPYNRAIETANGNLSVILGEAWQAKDLQSWAAMLNRYGTMKEKIQKSAEAGKQAAPDKAAQQDEQALKYLATYLDAVAEFRTELGAPDKIFKSAQKAFQEPDVSSKATHPLLKATWAIRAFRDSMGRGLGDDAVFWNLLERPLELAWRAMLAETERQLQEQWYRLRLGIRNQQDSGVVAEKIYGFATDGPAAAFLTQSGPRAPRTLLNQKVHFTDAFLQYLARLRVDAITNLVGPQTSQPAEPPPASIVVTN